MGIKQYISDMIKKIKAQIHLFEDQIDQKEKMYEERFGDPKDTEIKDILKEFGGNNGE